METEQGVCGIIMTEIVFGNADNWEIGGDGRRGKVFKGEIWNYIICQNIL